MPNPKMIDESPLTLFEVKAALERIEQEDKELNYRSSKAKDYLNHFVTLTEKQKNNLEKKLIGLKLVRLKEAHIVKIIDFLPTNVEELKVILQAYPVNMPKKDMENIVSTVKGILK